jgi:hypothetical protein
MLLLRSFVDAGLPAPDISRLFEVDHLLMQSALAPFSGA